MNVFLIIIIVILIVFILGFFVGNYFYDLAINSKTDKSKVINAPHNALEGMGKKTAEERRQEREQWLKTVGYTDKYVTAFDHLKLHAYQVENPNAGNKWVIACHGYANNAQDMFTFAQQFYTLGFNLLIPDARGAGMSEGNYIGMGWNERRDIVQWANELVAQDETAQIILYGVSMGGATVMMTSGEADLSENVKAIIEDCGYSSATEEFTYQLKQLFNLPAFPIINFASLVTKLRAGFWLGEASSIKQVSKATRPMLFIHGDSDTFVPSFMVDEVYAVADVPKEIYIAKGAGHGGSAAADPEHYWSLVQKFALQYLDK